MIFHASPHGFAKRLDIGRGGRAKVDQEVAMQLRDLRAAGDQSAAASGVYELPGLLPWRVLEGRAAGAALYRLGRLARLSDLVHFGGDGGTIARRALECGLGEDEIFRRA